MITLNEINIDQFAEEVKTIYKNYFPDSLCVVRFSTNIGAALFIDFYLAGDASECPSNYLLNDLFKCSFVIFFPDGTTKGSKFGTNTIECSGSRIMVKPTSKYVAFDTIKIPFRKTTGDASKILKALTKYIDKLFHTTLEQLEAGNIPDRYEALVAEKLEVD